MHDKPPEKIIKTAKRIGTAGRLSRLRFIWARALDLLVGGFRFVRFKMLLLFLDGRSFALSWTRGRTSWRISQRIMDRWQDQWWVSCLHKVVELCFSLISQCITSFMALILDFFNLNMHISNPSGQTAWSESLLRCGGWAPSKFGYLALRFKRGCETILNYHHYVMVPGWSQTVSLDVFGCATTIWTCVVSGKRLMSFLACNLACFWLWITDGFWRTFTLISVRLEPRYVAICHPEKVDEYDKVKEQFATALMVQFCFSEVEEEWRAGFLVSHLCWDMPKHGIMSTQWIASKHAQWHCKLI